MHLTKFSYLFVSETSQVGLLWSEFIGLEKKERSNKTAVEVLKVEVKNLAKVGM